MPFLPPPLPPCLLRLGSALYFQGQHALGSPGGQLDQRRDSDQALLGGIKVKQPVKAN